MSDLDKLPSGMLEHSVYLQTLSGLLGKNDLFLVKIQILDLPQINAQFGEETGERVIRSVRLILNGLDNGILVSMVSPSLYSVASRDPHDAHWLTRRIVEALAELNSNHPYPFLVTIGVGAVLAQRSAGLSIAEWTDRANAALRQSRREGEPVVFDAGFEVRETIRNVLGRINKSSSAPDGMRWVFQPVVDVVSGSLAGYEALCRWDLEGIGEVSPTVFVPIAEEEGVISLLDHWTVSFVRDHFEEILSNGGNHISVNIDPMSSTMDSFKDLVMQTAGMMRAHHATLVVELTEGAISKNLDLYKLDLRDFRSMGVKVGIDDFGTGETNLSSVSNLPCDYLKLDGSLLRQKDPAMRRGLLEIGIKLADLLGAKVVVEGVETEEDLQLIKMLGADFSQGWFTGRPIELRTKA